MQGLEVSGAVRHIYIYVIRRLKVRVIEQAVFFRSCLPLPLKILLQHKAVVSSLLTSRRRVVCSANFAVPKVSSSADVAVEDFTLTWQGALTCYYQPGQLDQGFLRGVTPLLLTTLSWFVTGRAWFPSIGPSLAGLDGRK